MEKDLKERVRILLQRYNLNPSKLAEKYQLNQKTLNNQINSDTTMSANTILLVLDAIPDVSAEWLLRGTGSMLTKENINPEQVFKALNMPSNSDKIIEVWMQFMEVTKGMQELYKQSR